MTTSGLAHATPTPPPDATTATGLIVLKALAPEPGLMPQAQASLAASSCKVQTDAPAKQAEAPRGKR